MITLDGSSLCSAASILLTAVFVHKQKRNDKKCRVDFISVHSSSSSHWLTDIQIIQQETKIHSRTLCRCGKPFDNLIVRGKCRTNVLGVTGVTGSRAIVAEKLIEMLNKNITPLSFPLAAVCAVYVAPMAYIARDLVDMEDPFVGFEPLIPTEKEALALINGTYFTAILRLQLSVQKPYFASIWSAALSMEVVCA